MDQRSLTFQLRFQRLLAKLFPQELYYIGGPDPLPPPLSPEEEREMTRRLKNHDETARASLIEHNLRWWSLFPAGLKIRAFRWRI